MILVALQASGYGLIGGWSSSNNELLQKEGMPLPFKPLTKEEISWLTALLPLGTLIGCFPFGLIGNKFGRKWPIICLTIPITVITINKQFLNHFNVIEIKICDL